jgi:hypothetical protein
MANGIPVRLSEALTVRARVAAEQQDRSLTEQVEHWARLGQAVEDAVLAATVQRLKARSHDADLGQRLELAASAEGRAKAAALIRSRHRIRHGIGPGGSVVQIGRARRAKKR